MLHNFSLNYKHISAFYFQGQPTYNVTFAFFHEVFYTEIRLWDGLSFITDLQIGDVDGGRRREKHFFYGCPESVLVQAEENGLELGEFDYTKSTGSVLDPVQKREKNAAVNPIKGFCSVISRKLLNRRSEAFLTSVY